MRHAKQLLYGIFYLAFWVAVSTGVYYMFVKPVPTCFDNIQNQDEEGVDCGGTCSQARMCLPDLEPIRADRAKVLPLALSASSTRISLIVEIGNPNLDWAVNRFSYVFNVYDTSGAKVGSFAGSSYIYAGEVKYLSLPNEIIEGVPELAYAEIEIAEPRWRKAKDFPKVEAAVVIIKTDVLPTVTARGTVANSASVPVAAELTAVFYNNQNDIIGVSGTVLDRLAAGEAREFAIFHPAMNDIAPERTRVFSSAYAIQ